VGSFGAALQTLFGGNITLYTQLCERARDDAYELMLRHAREMDANAVIGVRYDATEFGPGITEVLAYGTAVNIALHDHRSRLDARRRHRWLAGPW
jgi:uncharacterized protein YbjQ (UPF0145 family)